MSAKDGPPTLFTAWGTPFKTSPIVLANVLGIDEQVWDACPVPDEAVDNMIQRIIKAILTRACDTSKDFMENRQITRVHGKPACIIALPSNTRPPSKRLRYGR